MAQCVQSVQELIPDSFVPCVAALCSDDAERLTRLNHLSFAELLKPFTRLTSEGTWSSPGPRSVGARGRERGGGGRGEGDVYGPEGGACWAAGPAGSLSGPRRPPLRPSGRFLPASHLPPVGWFLSRKREPPRGLGALAEGGRSGAEPRRRPACQTARGGWFEQQRGASPLCLSPYLVILLFFL